MKKFLVAVAMFSMLCVSASAQISDWQIRTTWNGNATFRVFSSGTWTNVWDVPTTNRLRILQPMDIYDASSGLTYATFDAGDTPITVSRPSKNGPGTVTTTASNANVVGVGTKFTRWFQPGDVMTINAVTRTVSSIGDDTHITFTTTYPTSQSAIVYQVAALPNFFQVQASGGVVLDHVIATPSATGTNFIDFLSPPANYTGSIIHAAISGTGAPKLLDLTYSSTSGSGTTASFSLLGTNGVGGAAYAMAAFTNCSLCSAINASNTSSVNGGFGFGAALNASANNNPAAYFFATSNGTSSVVVVAPSASTPANTKMIDIQNATGTGSVASIDKEGDLFSNSITLTGTGGTSQVLKQTSAGAAITVAQLAASDLSNTTTGSGAVVLATGPSVTGLNVSDGDLELKTARRQHFTFEIHNTSGTIAQTWYLNYGAGSRGAGSFNTKISNVNSNADNALPDVTGGATAFGSGAGYTSSILIFDTPNAQVDADIIGAATIAFNDTGTAVVAVFENISSSVNSVTRNRPAVQFYNAATGAAFAINTTNIPAGKHIVFQVNAYIK